MSGKPRALWQGNRRAAGGREHSFVKLMLFFLQGPSSLLLISPPVALPRPLLLYHFPLKGGGRRADDAISRLFSLRPFYRGTVFPLLPPSPHPPTASVRVYKYTPCHCSIAVRWGGSGREERPLLLPFFLGREMEGRREKAGEELEEDQGEGEGLFPLPLSSPSTKRGSGDFQKREGGPSLSLPQLPLAPW